MKLKNIEIVNLSKAIQPLMSKDLSYKTALKVSKNAKIIDAKMKEVAEDERNLIEKYADGDIKESGAFKIKAGSESDFQKDREELFNFEHELDLYILSESELENIEIKPIELAGLECIVGRG